MGPTQQQQPKAEQIEQQLNMQLMRALAAKAELLEKLEQAEENIKATRNALEGIKLGERKVAEKAAEAEAAAKAEEEAKAAREADAAKAEEALEDTHNGLPVADIEDVQPLA